MTAAPPPGLLAEALELCGDAVIVTDAEPGPPGPTILYVNRAFTDMTGWTAAEAVGRSPRILQGPETDRATLDAARRAVETGRPFRARVRNRRKNGDVFLNEWSMTPRREGDGAVTHWISVQRDVTEEDAVARRLVESETRFADLAANIPGAILRYIRPPDGPDEVEYMSPGCVSIWEVDAATLQGDPTLLWRMVHPDDMADLAASVDRSAETLDQWSHRWRITTPSGARKWLHSRSRPRRREDGSVLWNTLILDVTEQVETDAALAQSREMFHQAQKLEALGKLTGGVAHDFNNLLAVVMGNLELLAENPDARDRDGCIGDALTAARRGRELTRSLLSFARQAPLSPERLDLNALVRDVAGMVRRTLPETIAVETRLAPAPPVVEADRSGVESALLNLVINARDAMLPDGGRLVIGTEVRAMTPADATGGPVPHLRLEVRDEGPGIPENIRDKVCEPFFTTKAVGEGSGLGLATAQGFMRQSRGRLEIAAAPEGGAAVALCFPVPTEAGPAQRAAEGRARAETAIGSVLVVEDEAPVRRVIVEQLARAGHRVVEAGAADAAEAAFAGQVPFDALVTDVIMPGRVQGAALAGRLRGAAPGLGVVFVTGHAPDPAAWRLPNARILQKPVDRARLLEAVAEAVRAGAATR